MGKQKYAYIKNILFTCFFTTYSIVVNISTLMYRLKTETYTVMLIYILQAGKLNYCTMKKFLIRGGCKFVKADTS